MRTGAMVLGLIGGIIGLLVALLHVFIGAIAAASGSEGVHSGLGWLTLVAAILGIVGGAMALAKPRTAAVLLLVGGLAGFVGSSAFWIPSGLLMLAGAVLAFLGRATGAQPAPRPQP